MAANCRPRMAVNCRPRPSVRVPHMSGLPQVDLYLSGLILFCLRTTRKSAANDSPDTSDYRDRCPRKWRLTLRLDMAA